MKCRGAMLGGKALAMFIGGCERRVQGPRSGWDAVGCCQEEGALHGDGPDGGVHFVRYCWFWIVRTDMADWRIPHPTRGTSLLPNSSTA